jgi:hypothetical protein
MKITATQKMKMQMQNRLACAAAIIYDHTIPGTQLAVRSELRRNQESAPQERAIVVGGVPQLFEVLARADQNMSGSLRRDILKSEKLWILIDDLRGQFVLAYLAKNAVGHNQNTSSHVGNSLPF